ncbi:hypothetical protein PZA11_005952 [Diplocarpon coronariae]
MIIHRSDGLEIFITSLYEIDSLIYKSAFILYKTGNRLDLLKSYKEGLISIASFSASLFKLAQEPLIP